MSTARPLDCTDPAFRRTGLGSSEVASAIGLGGFSDPMEIFLVKTGRVPPRESTEEMAWGHVIEPSLAAWYASKHHVAYLDDFDGRTPIPCPGEDWLWATPDRRAECLDTGRRRVVELKNVGSFMAKQWGEPGTDAVPTYYFVQVQLQMHCTGDLEADAVASLGGRPPQVWHVKRDDQVVAMVIERARRFWNHVVHDTPPDPQTPEQLAQLMKALHPSHVGEDLVEASGPLLHAMGELHEAESVAKEAKTLVDWTKGRIKKHLGDRPGCEGPLGTIRWKANKNGARQFRAYWKEQED